MTITQENVAAILNTTLAKFRRCINSFEYLGAPLSLARLKKLQEDKLSSHFGETYLDAIALEPASSTTLTLNSVHQAVQEEDSQSLAAVKLKISGTTLKELINKVQYKGVEQSFKSLKKISKTELMDEYGERYWLPIKNNKVPLEKLTFKAIHQSILLHQDAKKTAIDLGVKKETLECFLCKAVFNGQKLSFDILLNMSSEMLEKEHSALYNSPMSFEKIIILLTPHSIYQAVQKNKTLHGAAKSLNIHQDTLQKFMKKIRYQGAGQDFESLKKISETDLMSDYGENYWLAIKDNKISLKELTFKTIHKSILWNQDVKKTAIDLGVKKETLERFLCKAVFNGQKLSFDILLNMSSEMLEKEHSVLYNSPMCLEKIILSSTYCLNDIYTQSTNDSSVDKTATALGVASVTLEHNLAIILYKRTPLSWAILKKMSKQEFEQYWGERRFLKLEELTHNEVIPLGGIHQKYLTGHLALLPEPTTPITHLSVASTEQFSRHLEFVQLEHRQPIVDTKHDIQSIMFAAVNDTGDSLVNMTLHTAQPTLTEHDKPIFVFAGRKERAFVPQVMSLSASNIRIILVVPPADYEELKAFIQPGTDLLVISELTSVTHGKYDNYGLINTRRIAAFACAMMLKERYGVPHALMADDNIRAIHFNADSDVDSDNTWDTCFDTLKTTLEQGQEAVCVSLPTISNNGVKTAREGLLGSKLYMFDLKRLHSRFGDDASFYFLPFYPTKANAFWGEDYYFQLIFKEVFASLFHGYRELDPTQYGITRASVPGLSRHVVKPANALCDENMSTLFCDGPNALSELQTTKFKPQQCIENTIKKLQDIIEDNVARHKSSLQKSINTPLMAAHAFANNIVYKTVLQSEPINDFDFLPRLSQHLNLLKGNNLLHPYQQKIIDDVCNQLDEQVSIGQFTMATGSGKTYIEIFLAIAALLTGTTRPIVIVTPYKQLVQQAYEDFMAILHSFSELPIHPAQILKVDSSESSLSAETLIQNRTLDNQACVLICCEDSYSQLLASNETAVEPYQRPCMLLMDEFHAYATMLKEFKRKNPAPINSFIAGFSATPKNILSLLTAGNPFSIHYPRETAVAQGFLAPCIVDRFDHTYSPNNVIQIISQMPFILKQHVTPTGIKLVEQKGIIYVPNNYEGINYSQRLYEILNKENIRCFEINSDEPDSQKNLQAYKAFQNSATTTNILICKGMAKIGFSHHQTSWVICLRNEDAAGFCQSAGRAMRTLKNKPKIAYIMALQDAKLNLVFNDKNTLTADEEALRQCTDEYKQQRDVRQVKNFVKHKRRGEDSGYGDDSGYGNDHVHRRRKQEVHTVNDTLQGRPSQLGLFSTSSRSQAGAAIKQEDYLSTEGGNQHLHLPFSSLSGNKHGRDDDDVVPEKIKRVALPRERFGNFPVSKVNLPMGEVFDYNRPVSGS